MLGICRVESFQDLFGEKIQSQAIIHDPYYKECSIMAFYEVDETGIREWNKKYKDKALDENILEFN